ncbi:MAG: hypothetical protein KJ869_10900 [Candidatus Edwardsbacteria bacterium]|nr:hypothetical protein [Candidatus Edwardsbacteria bacterium]
MRNKAKNPFVFMTSSSLVTITDRKAYNIKELLEGIKEVSGSSIYHHSHQVYREWQTFGRPPIHDFGYWVGEVIREKGLGERLAAVDPTQYDDIRSFRIRLAEIIEEHLASDPIINQAPLGSQFNFCESTSIILDTGTRAGNLDEFIQALGRITSRSLYYHLFEARIRLHRFDNDFSIWLRDQLEAPEIADAISKLDISVSSLEQLRAHLFIILGKYRGVPPRELVKKVVQLPAEMIELLMDTISYPVRSLNRFFDEKIKSEGLPDLRPKNNNSKGGKK